MTCRQDKIATAQCLSCPNYGEHGCPLFSEEKTSAMHIYKSSMRGSSQAK